MGNTYTSIANQTLVVPIAEAHVRFGAHSGLKSDIKRDPKS